MSKTAFTLSASALILFFLAVSQVFAQPPEPPMPEDSSPMVEKNLFSPDRKPPLPGAPSSTGDQKGEKNAPTAVQLDGVFIYGDKKSALLRLKGPSQGKKKGDQPESPYVTVSEGEQVGDLRVVKIEARKITLEKEGEIQEVNLFETNKVSPPAQAAPKIHPAPTPQDQEQQAGDADGAAENKQIPAPADAKSAMTREERRAKRSAQLQKQLNGAQGNDEQNAPPPEPGDNSQEGGDEPEPPIPPTQQ